MTDEDKAAAVEAALANECISLIVSEGKDIYWISPVCGNKQYVFSIGKPLVLSGRCPVCHKKMQLRPSPWSTP